MGALFDDATNILREIYVQSEIDDLTFRDHALLTKMAKKDVFTDATLRLAIKIGAPRSVSSDPAVSYAAANSAGTMANAYGAFTGERSRCFNRALLDREAVLASKGKAALSNLLEDGTDGMLKAIGDTLAQWVYGDGTGALGAIDGSASGDTITLANPGDAAKFHAGDQLQVYNGTGPSLRTITAASGYSALGSGTAVTVDSVDEDSGEFTLASGDAAKIGSLTSGDVFIPVGMANNGGPFKGLASWIPASAPGATSFFGQDRSKDVLRLGGVRLDTPTARITSSIRRVCEKVKTVGGKNPDACFLNPLNWTAMVEQEAAKQITMETKFDSGFETVRVMTSGGPVMVYPDPDCPLDVGYCLTMSSWAIYHMNGLPHLVDDGGGQLMQPVDGTNSFMVKGAAYAWLGCDAPGRNGRFSIG